MSVIATQRPNFRRTHIEAHVLRTLAPFTTDIPECLAVVDDILFQSDVGRGDEPSRPSSSRAFQTPD